MAVGSLSDQGRCDLTGRSSRGRWQRVIEARKQSREGLGRDTGQGDLFDAPPKKKSTAYVPVAPPKVESRPSDVVGVVTLGEAAATLGLSRSELERAIAAGTIEALPGCVHAFYSDHGSRAHASQPSMNDHLREIRSHIDAAEAFLDMDDELDRLLNPRHTDHDRHVYLPTKVAENLAAARRELEAALAELTAMTAQHPSPN